MPEKTYKITDELWDRKGIGLKSWEFESIAENVKMWNELLEYEAAVHYVKELKLIYVRKKLRAKLWYVRFLLIL